jgi:uncharacterized protein YgiM (DUF1202 family)
MKKLIVSLMAVMLLVGFIPTTIVEASEVAFSEEDVDTRASIPLVVLHNGTNFRTGPGTHFTSLGHVHKGDRVVRTGATQYDSNRYAWYPVYILTGQNTGRSGWIRADLLRYDI